MYVRRLRGLADAAQRRATSDERRASSDERRGVESTRPNRRTNDKRKEKKTQQSIIQDDRFGR